MNRASLHSALPTPARAPVRIGRTHAPAWITLALPHTMLNTYAKI